MGVDISTWRARVGMFIPRTSQKLPLIFTAKAHRQPTNNDQATWLILENSLLSPPTSIIDMEPMVKADYKPTSTPPANKGHMHVACFLLLCTLYLLWLLSVSLIDSTSENRPSTSYPPVLCDPVQNETSPVQLSYVQLLMILMCGDVEINPGPPKPGPLNKPTFKQIAERLTTLTVPAEDVIYPEYCSNVNVDFTLKKKDQGYLEQMEDIVRTVSAMLNYAGGVITLNPQTANSHKDLDEWAGKIREQMDLVFQKEVSSCVELPKVSKPIVIYVRKCWKSKTYKLPLYTRRDAATVDGDISMISEDVRKPAFISNVSAISWEDLNYEEQLPLNEGRNLEFKCYLSTHDATSLMDRILSDRKGAEPKLIRTLLAFTNTEGGGDAIIGVRENHEGEPILEGQKLSAADEGEVRRCINELMIKGLNGEQRIWPFTPNGSEWTINCYPLRYCPGNNRHVLIHIRVNQVAGYVLADEPEAYTMTCDGDIRHVNLNEWKNCFKPKPAPELLKLGTVSEAQDNDEDDIGDEQFKQLVNDLKSLRVTLSLKHIKTVSWKKDSEDSQDDIQPGVNMDTCVNDVSKSDLLKPSCPSTWVPDREILDRWITNNKPEMMDCVNVIAKSHSHEAVVMGTKFCGHIFPGLSLEVPQHHAFNFFVLQGNAELDLWIVFDDCKDIVTCKKYTNSAIRILRFQLLSYMHQHTDTKAVKLAIKAKVWSIADNCIKYETTGAYAESTVELPVLQKAVAYCLLQGQSHIRNRLGEEYLTALTKDQLSVYLLCPYMNALVVQGPPGSGKSIIAQHLCEKDALDRNIDKTMILYICPCQPLAEFIRFQGRCDVKFTKTEELVQTIREALVNGILLIIIEDAHLFLCSKDEWIELLKQFTQQGSAERRLAIFLDPDYQNFQGDKSRHLFEAIAAINSADSYSKVYVHYTLPKMIRNSRNIFSFFKKNAGEYSYQLTCAHDFQGDGVSVTYFLDDLFQRDRDNPVIKLMKEIVGLYNFEENFTYQMTDITILVDVDGRGNAEQAVQDLCEIFCQFYPEAKIQRASQFPVQGTVIEELKSFSGLETRACILVLTCKETSVMDNPPYKCFVASRAITKLVFLLHGDTVDSSFRQLKFSEEKQWQELTRQLLKEIPEKGLSEEWLRTNVPDTEYWQRTKSFIILRCQQQIELGNPRALAVWVDRNMPPAWRHDAQFVKSVIGFVCKRTIEEKSPSGYVVDSGQLRAYLGALNCMYGAPEALQLQALALDSVYDCVVTLKHPENVLQKVLEIMWHDGYLSRQAILSWYDRIQLQGKDLEGQIQERMRARQEVGRWMEYTWMEYTRLMHYPSTWYDIPHYQRVSLHALCQLAVTWQGDTCTVDKNLLFHYIPQLFYYTMDGLQLLYAVQCVLHHLQNPPGLAVAVLQAVLTTIRLNTVRLPLITITDWDKWRNTENPVYDEGRNIIQEQGQILDLIVLVSSKVTMTEINIWLHENIPQDRLPDAFIITAVCLFIRGEDVTLIREFMQQNVPQSMQNVVHDTWNIIIIERCLQKIQSGYDWEDSHILLAGVRNAQFVRAAITAVCQRTMYLDKIDSRQLRYYLGVLNCLWGEPDTIQLQALYAVYDHVRSLQNPAKILPEVLDIMWSDGYISKQVILSWADKLVQEIPASSQKDLGEQMQKKMKTRHEDLGEQIQKKMKTRQEDLGVQIQQRMKARQEFRRWMDDATQFDPSYTLAWYNSPHYQRVALHALCQLAVTGHKVDKDLLFHYIPQLFCHTQHGLQLLYAVQCVLHHLRNPPGLAVAVIKALVSPIPPRTEPMIIESELEKWRKTKHPAYEEGRESMLLAINNSNI